MLKGASHEQPVETLHLGEIKARGRVLRFTGDIWKNHPCCVITINEELTKRKPEWTQKVINVVVRAAIYASENKKEVAKLLSKDGEGYLIGKTLDNFAPVVPYFVGADIVGDPHKLKI